MSELSQQESAGLDALKAKMSKSQRQEMAEIIQKEMERRGMVEPSMKKESAVRTSNLGGKLSQDQVKELYSDVGQAVQKLRVKKLEDKLANARGQQRAAAPRAERATASFAPRLPRSGNGLKLALMYGVCGMAGLKIASSAGLFEPSIATARPALESHETQLPAPTTRAEAKIAAAEPVPGKLYSQSEKEILTQLDGRRVELERRREALDRREQELKNQSQVLTERLAELRGLTTKLQELRKERDNKQEGRLAQLANVYGAMEPAEAALLVARLDDNIALELLERMPEKRIGQVLGSMEKGRAVELTKLLTEKKIVN